MLMLKVNHSKVGKLLVATTQNQIPKLKSFAATGAKNGMTDLQWLDAKTAMDMEPALHCVAAMLSPSTGIIDSHG
jgi:L-2-hydroxyglutarate oxidase LhgO